MLPEEAVAANPGLNFLNSSIASWALDRASHVVAEGGTLEFDRLQRNMLSSMPLCFNFFGALRQIPRAAARGLASVLGLDINEIVDVEVEWAPDPELHLRDRTAFDAIVRYRTSQGHRAFLGIETKYTESFSEQPYDSERYGAVTKDPTSGFKPGAAVRLVDPATNQLWRNSLLVHSLRSTDEFDDGHVVVLTCEGDAHAAAAIAGLRRELKSAPTLLRSATYEELVDGFVSEPDLAAWALEFRRRYLDLTPLSRRD